MCQNSVCRNVRSGVTPRVVRAPAGSPFLPGPGFRVSVASSDGRDTVTGPGRAECSRPIPVSPDSGPASARPATGFDRRRDDCIFTGRCVGAPSMRSRRRTAVQTWPPARSGTGCSPLGQLPSSRVASGLPRRPAVRRAHLRSPRVREFLGIGCAAGRACARTPSRRASLPRACRPRPACRARRFRCVWRRTGQARAGPAPNGSGGARPLLRRCGRMRGRSPPYTPRPCRLVAASPVRRRRNGSAAATTRGDRLGIRR
jgi:hypothetical protein